MDRGAARPARQVNWLRARGRVIRSAGLPAVWQYSRGTKDNGANEPTGLPPMHSWQVINHTPAGYELRQIDSSNAPLRMIGSAAEMPPPSVGTGSRGLNV